MAGTTFHNFASREAQNTVDWSKVSSQISTALSDKAKAIEEEKATVTDNSNALITTLNDSTQSENQSVKDWALEGSNSIQEQALILKRMLENGKMSKRDYTANFQALTDGGAQLGQLVKSYNEQWATKMERGEIGANGQPLAQDAEAWFMEQMEGFSNFKTSGIFVNPLNSKVSIGKRVLKDPNQPYNAQSNPYTAAMSNNASDYATLPALLSRSKVQYNFFDANKAVDGQVDSLGKVIKSIQKGKVETWENSMDDPEYKKIEKSYIESTRAGSNITNVSSVLTNSIGQLDVNGTLKNYGFTQDVTEATNDQSLILFSQDEVPIPIFDKTGTNGTDQIKAYDTFMQTMMRGKLNDIEKARVQAKSATSAETKAGNEKKFAQSKIRYMRTLYNSSNQSDIESALSNLSQRSGGKARYEIGKISDDALEINFITYTEDKSQPGTFIKTEHPKIFSRKGSEDNFVRGIASTMSDYGGIDTLLDNAGLGTAPGKAGKPGNIKWGSAGQKAKTWDNIGKGYKNYQYETAEDYFEDSATNNTPEEAKERTDWVIDKLARNKANTITTEIKNGKMVITYPGPNNKPGGMSFEFADNDKARKDLHALIKAIYNGVDNDEVITKEMIKNAISNGTPYTQFP